ncbi:MAG: hypothetical protein ACRD07_14500 [Acidimicrobiales bacterium]
MAQIVYELSFEGAASDTLRAIFEDHDVVVAAGVTTIRGSFEDQAALVETIERINALGLELIELHTVAETAGNDLRAWDPAGDRAPERRDL